MKWLVAGCSLMLAMPVWAGLEFQETSQEMDVPLGDPSFEVTYRYENTGDETVRIVSADRSCSCLDVQADKLELAPGDTGRVVVTFNVGGQSGNVEKSVTVVTDDDQRTRLAVRANIAEAYTIEPKMARWTVGDEPTTQTITFEVNGDYIANVVETDSSRKSNVNLELRTLEEGKRYELDITPVSTERAMMGVIRFETDHEVETKRRQMAFWNIGNPGEDDE